MSGVEDRTDANVAVYFASETGRAKACARRAARRLASLFPIDSQSTCGGSIERTSFDEIDFIGRNALPGDDKRLVIIFISTTGDAEMPSPIQRTWNRLLSKSLSTTMFANVQFALFALGDRAVSYSAASFPPLPSNFIASFTVRTGCLLRCGAEASCSDGPAGSSAAV